MYTAVKLRMRKGPTLVDDVIDGLSPQSVIQRH